MSALLIVLLGLALFAYVALPLLHPAGADPLPDERDPVTRDLEEERDALLRAIRELGDRQDLPAARRDQLRARYEAKAAKVLRLLDERSAAVESPPAPPRRRQRPPYAALAVLGVVVLSATVLSAYVLPRVGEGATLTAFFEEDLAAGRELRRLQRAAERDPSSGNLLALADAYWSLDDAENARDTYLQAVAQGEVPAAAYRRLGLLSLQSDLAQATGYLETARRLAPQDLDTLYTLGEVYFASGRFAEAAAAWQAYLEAPGGAGDEQVASRLELAQGVAPLAERAAAEPGRDSLLALAGALWQANERQRAFPYYFQVLTEFDANDPVALGRTGQLLFTAGRVDDAVAFLERAVAVGGAETETLLFLGNAYYSQERYQEAIAAWEAHLAQVGEGAAGRVPELIAEARARLAGGAAGPDANAETPAQTVAGGLGAAVFAQSCAACHGPSGGGGAGPALAGNPRAADAESVAAAVRFGRGAMPAFAALLSDEELSAVVSFVTQTLAGRGGG